MLSIPVMEIRARFVSRVYPVRGGDGGNAFRFCCSYCCGVDENGRLRIKQRAHIDGMDLPGRIMVVVAGDVEVKSDDIDAGR